jgi:hypothetical protein
MDSWYLGAMENFTFLFGQNGWFIAGLLFLGCVVAAEFGYFFGKRRRVDVSLKKEHVGAVQGALAALLGLLLAFSVSMAVTRFESRKVAVVDEANAIGTAYLRLSLLPEPRRSQADAKFKRYLDVRIQMARPDWFTQAGVQLRAEQAQLQRDLWLQGVSASQPDPRAVTIGLYIQAVNDMIDSAGRRDAGLRNHLPESVLYLIFVVCVSTLAVMGYASGLAGARSVTAVLIVSFVVAAVVFVMLDFDRPYRGVITVGQQSLLELRDMMSLGPPIP